MRRTASGFVMAFAACVSLSTPTARARSEMPRPTGSAERAAHFEKFSAIPKAAPQVVRQTAAKVFPSDERVPEWVLAKPGADTQKRTSVEERGVNPCMTRDPGFRGFTRWNRTALVGQFIVPRAPSFAADGEFNLMLHFHGHEAARKEWVQVMDDTVFYGVDLGLGSGAYAKKFSNPAVFRKLVSGIERAVARHAGKKSARIRRLGLSAWSAGYGAVEQILRNSEIRQSVDTVVLLDGLHTGYVHGSLKTAGLRPFVSFARSAASSEKLMFVSHSSIIPPGYASTTETSNFLVWQVGGKPSAATHRDTDPMGLSLISRYSDGNFHVRGYSGNDTHDHCAHLGLYRDVLRVHVAPRWAH